MVRREVIIGNLGLMFLSLGRDWLSMFFAFVLSEQGFDIKTVCLFGFIYCVGNLFSVIGKQEQYNTAINCFYFLAIIVLLQQSIISLRTLLVMRMLQGFCFAAVIYAIQELIFSLQKEQPQDYQKQTQKIYIANITIAPLIARYSGFFLRAHKINILSFVAINLIIGHFCIYLAIKNKQILNQKTKNLVVDKHSETPPIYNKKIILFYFFLCSAVRSSLFFLIYSLKQANFSDSTIGKILCCFAAGEILSRVFFETNKKTPIVNITYLLIGFCLVLGFFLFQVVTNNFIFFYLLCLLIGFIQGKISDLSFVIGNTVVENISSRSEYVMRIVSNFSFTMAPILFLPTMYFFTPIVGILLSRILLSILAAIVLNIS